MQTTCSDKSKHTSCPELISRKNELETKGHEGWHTTLNMVIISEKTHYIVQLIEFHVILSIVKENINEHKYKMLSKVLVIQSINEANNEI